MGRAEAPVRPAELEPYPHGIQFGEYLPETFVENDDDTYRRTGIRGRFVASEFETTLFMVRDAINDVSRGHPYLGMLAVSSSYPQRNPEGDPIHLSTNATRMNCMRAQRTLDVYAACSGGAEMFHYIKQNEPYFLSHPDIILASTEDYGPTLVDQSLPDALTIDPSRAQKLFSAGAYAMSFSYGKDLEVLSAIHRVMEVPEGAENPLRMPIDEEAIYQMQQRGDAVIHQPVPGSSSGFFEQNGRHVFEAVLRNVPDLVEEVIDAAKLKPGDIRMVIPHQGSGKMIEGLARRIDIALSRDYEKGNFSSGSLFKAMKKEYVEGNIERGDHIVAVQFGAGPFQSASVLQFK